MQRGHKGGLFPPTFVEIPHFSFIKRTLVGEDASKSADDGRKQFSSKEEVDEVLHNALPRSRRSSLLFSVVERRMEFLGPPPCPTWVMAKGMYGKRKFFDK